MVRTSTEPSASTSTDPQTSSSDMTSNNEMVSQQLSVAKTVLLQAVDLLDNHLVSDQQLTVQSRFLPGSTIGISYIITFEASISFNFFHRQTFTPCTRSLRVAYCLHLEPSASSSIVRYKDTRYSNGNKPRWCSNRTHGYDQTTGKGHPHHKLPRTDISTCYHSAPAFFSDNNWAGGEQYFIFSSHFFLPNVGQLWFASLHCVHHWSMVSRIDFLVTSDSPHFPDSRHSRRASG